MSDEKHYVDARKAERHPDQGFLPPPVRDRKSRWGFRGMTVRDWLPIVGALLIPVVIAAGTWVITLQQGKIEDQRAEADRALATQRAQDEALQAYLDQMGTLMLEKHLRESKEDSEVRILAQARTLTVLGRLDTSRKDAVMHFLLESDLVHSVGESAPVIGLGGANLDGVDMHGANLSGAHLSNTYLNNAYLFHADLSNADLHQTVQQRAHLGLADLSGADLSDASLARAHLNGTDLGEADLGEADLSEADLSGAILYGAKGTTESQLTQAKDLRGALMPNGQKYEDWLKARGGRK